MPLPWDDALAVFVRQHVTHVVEYADERHKRAHRWKIECQLDVVARVQEPQVERVKIIAIHDGPRDGARSAASNRCECKGVGLVDPAVGF